jgi:thiol:disulfide interchange protein DsbC
MKRVFFGLMVALSAVAVQAKTPIDAKLQAAFADIGLQVNSVADSPVPGLLQVLTDKGLFFAANNGQFLFEGNVYDLKNKMLLNDSILQTVRQDGVKKYQNSTIEFKAPNEKHVITVFTDTSCGYCRKMHNELQSYLDAGISIRYLAFPRGGLQGGTFAELQSIWCASNPQKTLTAAKAGDTIETKQCSNKVAEHYALGQSFGISGTPAIVLPDGSLIPGYQPAAALAQVLATQASK